MKSFEELVADAEKRLSLACEEYDRLIKEARQLYEAELEKCREELFRGSD